LLETKNQQPLVTNEWEVNVTVYSRLLSGRLAGKIIGTWELIYNTNFKVVEFDYFKMNARLVVN